MNPVISIQYLRGLAAFLVLLQHVSYKDKVYSGGEFNMFGIGHMGVDIFFIISGFIMAYTFRPKLGAVRFLYNRVLRIIPLYWLTSVIALVGYLYAPGLINGSKEPDILSSFLLLPSESRYLNPNGWTLSFEFLFYLIFSFSFVSTWKTRFFVPSFFIMSFAVLGFFYKFDNIWLKFVFNTILIEFLFGMVVFKIYEKLTLNVRTNDKLSLYSLILLIFSVVFYFSDFKSGVRLIDFGVPALFICFFVVSLESKLNKSKSKFMEVLGDSSYSIYLTHAFVVSAASVLLSHVNLVHSSFLFSMILTVLSLLFGCICYLYIEVPISSRLKRVFK